LATISPVTNQPKAISLAASGDNTAIEGVDGYSVVVHALYLTFAASEDPELKASGGTSYGAYQNLTVLELSEMECGDRFVLPPGEALVIALPGGADCSGTIWYSLRRAG